MSSPFQSGDVRAPPRSTPAVPSPTNAMPGTLNKRTAAARPTTSPRGKPQQRKWSIRQVLPSTLPIPLETRSNMK